MGFRIATAGMLSTLMFTVPANAASTYYVGNSLTYDANWEGINHFNASIGTDGAYGFHIKCGSSLDSIYTNPTEVCVGDPTYGTFPDALPTHNWDRVSLEPFYEPIAGATGSAARFRDFVGVSKSQGRNANTNYYLYAAWPSGSDVAGFNYATAWTAAYNPADSNTFMTRDYFSQLNAQLRTDPSLAGHLFVVPAGEVIFELDREMKAGLIPGFASAKDLYRDGTHFNDYGRYAAALTMFSVMNRTSPVGLDVSYWYSLTTSMSDATRDAIQNAVWKVVQDNAAITGVPEPTSLALVAVAAGLGLRRRRET